MKDKQMRTPPDGLIVNLFPEESRYTVSKVTYIVESRCQPWKIGSRYKDEEPDNVSLRSRLERLIKNNAAHLIDAAACDIMEAEYVPAVDTAGDRKETNEKDS